MQTNALPTQHCRHPKCSVNADGDNVEEEEEKDRKSARDRGPDGAEEQGQGLSLVGYSSEGQALS